MCVGPHLARESVGCIGGAIGKWISILLELGGVDAVESTEVEPVELSMEALEPGRVDVVESTESEPVELLMETVLAEPLVVLVTGMLGTTLGHSGME